MTRDTPPSVTGNHGPGLQLFFSTPCRGEGKLQALGSGEAVVLLNSPQAGERKFPLGLAFGALILPGAEWQF